MTDTAAIDAVGDKLIAEWRAAATHSRIRAFRQYWDEAELLEGLGLLPDD